MGSQTDEELMILVQRQDISAFEQLFQRYEQRIFAFFWRLSADRQEAEDGTQETFLRLWRARARYVEAGKFSTYLFQIARNHFLHEQDKRNRRRSAVLGPLESHRRPHNPPAPDSADGHLVAREIQTAVNDAVARLPEPQRLAYVLSEQQGMSYKQVADVLDCPVGTVSSRKVQAIRTLRQMLQPLRDDFISDDTQSRIPGATQDNCEVNE
ncbi:MAG: RNA polymerase sigma factor [Planctomycetota bacterium]|jgi:RNA polymerase sigma-70 factor (ECF subfamily)